MSVIKKSMAAMMENIGGSLLEEITSAAKILVGQVVEEIDGLLRKPYATQLRAIRGIYEVLVGQSRVALLNADTGTGKTIMGIAVAFMWFSSKTGIARLAARMAGGINVVVCCPPTLCQKWAREVGMTVDSARVTVCQGKGATQLFREAITAPKSGLHFIVAPDTTVRAHYSSQRPELKLFGSEKLNAKRDAIAIAEPHCRNKIGDVLARCPRCGQLFKKRIGQEGEFAYLTVEQMSRKTSIRCAHLDPHTKKPCNEVWRAPLHTSEKTVEVEVDGEITEETLSNPHIMARKVSLAYWAKKFARRQELIDLVLIDEAHRAKDDGIHGEATRWLVNAGKRAILLTGTLTGGYARDLFYLLYMVNPSGMRQLGYKYSDVSRFCETYGAAEVKRWFEKAKTAGGKDKKCSSSRHRPGISSNVFPDLLVDRTVFVSLDELEIEMPAKKEFLEVIPMDSGMAETYGLVCTQFGRELKRLITSAGMSTSIASLISKSISVRASWVDRLKADTIDGMVDDGKGNKVAVSIPMFDYDPVRLTNKDARMLSIVKANKAEGRKVLVYASFTGKRDCAARMAKMFEDEGVRAVVLGDQVSAANREQWIHDQVADGIDVLITNPARVKEGYDLIMFPTIIMAQPTLDLFTHRQAMARAYRPGQTQEVRHYFLAYEGTIQEQLLVLAASKLDSALLAEGNLAETALLEVSESQDSIMRELIKAVVDGNEHLLKLPKPTVVASNKEYLLSSLPITSVVVTIEEEGVPVPAKVVSRPSLFSFRKARKGSYHPDQLLLFDFCYVDYEPATP